MMPIPEELLEQIERGNVLLFIGERIVRDAAGRAILDQLVAQLAARCGITDTEDLAFPEVAQAYEDDKGRQALVQFVRDQLEALGDEPQQTHRLIAGLTDCTVLTTTCLDRRLERAFEEAGRPLDVIIGNLDVAFEDGRKARLYKLRGSVEQVKSLVLTEDDYETFFEDQASISVVLRGYLARKTILFIGYDLGGWGNSLSIHTTGQSGHPLHSHYADIIGSWQAVNYHPMHFDKTTIEADREGVLIVTP